jgi:hypothetical protein
MQYYSTLFSQASFPNALTRSKERIRLKEEFDNLQTSLPLYSSNQMIDGQASQEYSSAEMK